jgi:DNA-binding transcriptional LysR family regulator
MELRHLEQIVAIRRAKGFTGAARELGISQPTLSKSIARLEAQLSFKLFDRTGSGARTTAHGEFIAERAEALLQNARGLMHEVQQLARGEAGRLRIGVGPVARMKILPRIIRQTSARYPKLQLTTVQEGAPSLLRSLQEGRLDVVFAYWEFAAEYGDLIRVKVFEDRTIMAVRPQHPALAGKLPVESAELLKYPLAMSRPTPSLLRWLGELSREQADNLGAFVSDDYGVIKQRPMISDTVALAPRFIFEPEIDTGALVELPTTRPNSQYECWMLTTPERWSSPLVKMVADFARQPD